MVEQQLHHLRRLKAHFEFQINELDRQIRHLEAHKHKYAHLLEHRINELERNLKILKNKKWKFERDMETKIRHLHHRKTSIATRLRA